MERRANCPIFRQCEAVAGVGLFDVNMCRSTIVTNILSRIAQGSLKSLQVSLAADISSGVAARRRRDMIAKFFTLQATNLVGRNATVKSLHVS